MLFHLYLWRKQLVVVDCKKREKPDVVRLFSLLFFVIVPESYCQASALSFAATSACLLGYRWE